MTRATTEATARYFLRRDEGKQEGPFTLNEVLRMLGRVDHGYTGDSLYRRSGQKEWKPLRAFAHFEFADPELGRLGKLRSLGIKYVEWLGTGLPDECAACKKLDGKIFPINATPPMPPTDCRCELWCACLFVAVGNASVDKPLPL